MFRRKPVEVDRLLTAQLPERRAEAHDRIAQQHDPALLAALSERELREERSVAESVRDHNRRDRLAQAESAQSIAGVMRRAQEDLVRAEAGDLVTARRALAEQRRQGSAHAQVADLFRKKTWTGRALAGVVAAAMLYSAVNVQHNLAPGGPSEPLYWASYLLEALISTVLVAFMVNSAAVSRWRVSEDETLIRWLEGALLAMSVGLNVYPYVGKGDLYNIAVHSVAPVMVGVALFAHTAVMRRYGLAIERAVAAADAAGDDIAERMSALADTAHFAIRTDPTAPTVTAPTDDDRVLAEYEDELRAIDDPAIAPLPRATEHVSAEPIAIERARPEEPITSDRARPEEPIARDEPPVHESDRAPIAREDRGPARGIIAQSIARAAHIARDTETTARAIEDSEAEPIARDEQPAHETDRSPIAHGDDSIARAETAPIAAHTPAELETDHAPIAAHDSDQPLADASESDRPRADVAPAEESVAREQESIDRARTAPIALVSVAREDTDRARPSRADRAREASTTGALARATEPAPIARGDRSRADDHGPFDRELSRAEAGRFARAVSERGLSKQPVSVLTEIYLLASQGHKANGIGTQVGLPHSTVGRALSRVDQVVGPRPI
ncbi:hypothetical protein [Nocardia alba]|uniref:Uncharacterized protein n=1 Tax=Nocardia alba TaxID=225051 RepID=A0A4R1FDM2_9NOCA|nr:hypothetical protein [Nocardia alba]TCJ89918.1 hypothetical protein DFR71_6208 [Nocardia alba]